MDKNEIIGKFQLRLEELVSEKIRTENITQGAVAQNIGIQKGQLSKYLNMDTEPRITVAQQIANYFNVSVDYLLGNTDIRTLDERSIAIHRQTGLSEEAIRNLGRIGELSCQQRNQAPDSLSSLEILNELLSSASCFNFSQGLYKYINYKVDDTKEFQLSEDGSLFLARKKKGLISSIKASSIYPTSLLEDLYLKNITQELSRVKERHTILKSAEAAKTTDRKKRTTRKLVTIKERASE